MKLSLCLVLAVASVVSAHVIGVYQGQNIPFRNPSNGQNSDSTQSVNGPCGETAVFGANGITEVVPGQVINMQLKYASPHPNPNGGPNYFAVAMMCTSGAANTLDSATPLRLYDTTTVNGQSTQKNQVNNIGVTPVTVNAEFMTAIPFTFPFKSPAGGMLTEGDFCVVSIMDERSWGQCIDVRVGSAPGPIVAGVITPVVGVGAAAAIFFARSTIGAKLMPGAQPNPDGKLWRVIFMTVVTLILAIVACADPSWTVGDWGKSGPWSFCPTSSDCYSAVASGIAAMYAVRVFVITMVIAGIIALACTLGAFWQKLDAQMAARVCTILYMYMSAAAFISFMVWTCVLSVGGSLGGALIVDIIVIVFAGIGAMLSYAWLKAAEAAPKQEFSTSGPSVSSPSGNKAKAAPAPVSYPSATATVTTSSSPKAASSYATKGQGGPAGHPNNYKWGSWEEIYDAENTAYYYFNHSNGESIWEPPAGWPHPARA